MTNVAATKDQAKTGLGLASSKENTIEIRTAFLELLVGGPYDGHPYGHTALRINVGKVERVYDYGRYGLYAGPVGQGVLRIWTSFIAYLTEENSLDRVTHGFRYDIPVNKAEEINAFFVVKINGKKIKEKLPHHEDYVIDEYYALGPNCTTVSMDGAKMALPTLDDDWKKHQKGRGLSNFEKNRVNEQGWPKRTFLPADLDELLKEANPKPKKIFTYKK
jgi:hypothetical protein